MCNHLINNSPRNVCFTFPGLIAQESLHCTKCNETSSICFGEVTAFPQTFEGEPFRVATKSSTFIHKWSCRNFVSVSVPERYLGLLGLCCLLLASKSVGLRSLSLDTSLTGCLDLGTFGVHLVSQGLLTLLLSLGLVNLEIVSRIVRKSHDDTYVFNKSTLVLETVTLGRGI